MAKPRAGGQDPQYFKNTPRYSQADLNALSKLGPDPMRAGPDGSAVPMCDICGEPIPGSARSTPAEFLNEIMKGRHFTCHAAMSSARQRAMDSAMRAPWDDENLTEEERAKLFDDAGVDPRDAKTVEARPPFTPTKGSMPLKEVIDGGGLLAKDPKVAPETLIPAPEQVAAELAALEEASRLRDAELAHEFTKGDPGAQPA